MNSAVRARLSAGWVADDGGESHDTTGAAAEYLEAIAGDPVRQASVDDLDAYRYVTGVPRDGRTVGWHAPGVLPKWGADDRPPTELTAEEQNWLEGRRDPPDAPPSIVRQSVAEDRRLKDGRPSSTVWPDRLDRRARQPLPPFDEDVDGYVCRRANDFAWQLWYAWERPLLTRRPLVAIGSALMEGELPLEFPSGLLAGPAEVFVPVIEGVAFRGLKTLVVGQSKAGKTFSTLALAAADIRSGKIRVLWLSEESRATIISKLKTFDLEDCDNSLMIVRKSRVLESWDDVVRKIEVTVAARNVDAVIVDTARPWFNLDGEQSNSPDVIGKAFDSLNGVVELGAALVVLHQAPWDKLRARGSTEFHASADLVISVVGQGGDPRVLTYVGGRLDDPLPPRTIRWAGDHAEDLGSSRRRDTAAHRGLILEVLESDRERWWTADEVAERADLHPKTVGRHLRQLVEKNLVALREGQAIGGGGGGGTPNLWRRSDTGLWLQALGGIFQADQDVS